jgi:hypothetical protein
MVKSFGRKSDLYKILLCSVMVYDSEAWTLPEQTLKIQFL